jgi:hypothetical protein
MKTPDPKDATKKPEVDLVNEIKKINRGNKASHQELCDQAFEQYKKLAYDASAWNTIIMKAIKHYRNCNTTKVFSDGYVAGYNQHRVDCGQMTQEKADKTLIKIRQKDRGDWDYDMSEVGGDGYTEIEKPVDWGGKGKKQAQDLGHIKKVFAELSKDWRRIGKKSLLRRLWDYFWHFKDDPTGDRIMIIGIIMMAIILCLVGLRLQIWHFIRGLIR